PNFGPRNQKTSMMRPSIRPSTEIISLHAIDQSTLAGNFNLAVTDAWRLLDSELKGGVYPQETHSGLTGVWCNKKELPSSADLVWPSEDNLQTSTELMWRAI